MSDHPLFIIKFERSKISRIPIFSVISTGNSRLFQILQKEVRSIYYPIKKGHTLIWIKKFYDNVLKKIISGKGVENELTDNLKVKASKAADDANVAAHTAYDDASVVVHNALKGAGEDAQNVSDDAKMGVHKAVSDAKIAVHKAGSDLKKK